MSSAVENLKPTVFVIDDDEAVQEALGGLFRSIGLGVEIFGSIQAFLSGGSLSAPGCIVLDVRLPGLSGLEFQQELVRKGISRSIVFISGHADVPMSVRAMKAGAIEFLTKPVREQELLDAVHLAIEDDRARRDVMRYYEKMRADYATLTLREREIMALVVTGQRNKQIASSVGISEATVKLHRGHVMQKMHAVSVADLVRMADAMKSSYI